MKTIKYILILFMAFIFTCIKAQNKTSLYYSIGIPTSNTHDYISKTSWRGLIFEYEHFTQPKLAIGIQFGWNTFYEEMPRNTYIMNNGAMTSKQLRYLNNIPIHLTGKYYFKEEEDAIFPFIGFGIGTNYMEQKTKNGLYTTTFTSWPFAINPKAGFLVPINDITSLSLQLEYNYTFKTSEMEQQSWLGVNIGFCWDY